jgi:hypothetical protein
MIKYILTLVFVQKCIFCIAQEPLTINNKFQDIHADAVITTFEEKDISNGFSIQFLNPTDITGFQLKKFSKLNDPDNAENFDVVLIGKPVPLANGFRYDGLKPKPDKNGFIKIRIFKGDEAKVVRVKVNKNDDDNDCDFVVTVKEGCANPEYSNKFGLLETDLGKNEVVYVYDNNKLAAKRRFYKISWEREHIFGKKVFDMRKANFSKETLTPGKQVYIRLANVNLFMLDVAVNDSLVDYFSEPLLNRFFIPDTATQGTLIKKFQGVAPESNRNKI